MWYLLLQATHSLLTEAVWSNAQLSAEIFVEELKGYKESMRYGGPCYEKDDVAEAGFASQKNYIGVYILKKGVMDRYKGELKGVSMGKGVMRFTNFQKIDFEVVRKMVAGTYSSSEKVC